MTTIYNKNFLSNISRINEPSSTRDSKSVLSTDIKNEFKTILADLEHKKEQENKEVSPQIEKSIIEETKQFKEIKDSKELVNNITFENKRAALETTINNPNIYQTVKFSGLDVKNLTAEPPKKIEEVGLSKLINTKIEIFPPVPQALQLDEKPKLAPIDKKDEIKNAIATAGKYFGIDPNLGLAVAEAESSFDSNAVSKDGYESKGLFQLLDSTADLMKDYTGTQEAYDPFDPAQNTYLGMGYLRRLHDLFSSENNLGFNIKTQQASSAEDLEKLAVAAYNAGEGSVAKAQQQAQEEGKDPALFSSIESYLPKSTQSYVEKVSRLRENYLKEYQKNKIS